MPSNSDRTPATRLRERTAALTALAGYGAHDPLMIGVQQDGAPPVFLIGGLTAAGEPLTAGTIVYTASLSKQITAACAALLVRQGRLDIESTVAQWMPELPAELVRLADQGSGFVIIALDDDEDRMAALTDAMIEELSSGFMTVTPAMDTD
jgi:CubicO group peptidase (beta-lactamase class C family)